MQRREFLITVGAGAFAAACGTDDTPVDAPRPIDATPNCAANGAIPTIMSNHGHLMVVTADEINAPADRDYDITGGADHSHDVAVSAAQFQMLAENTEVAVTSSVGDGHSHRVTIRCR